MASIVSSVSSKLTFGQILNFGTVWCGLFLCYSMRVEFDRFCKEFKVCGISLQVWPALIFYNGPKRSSSSCCCNNVIMSGQCTNGLKNDSNLFHVNLSLWLSFILSLGLLWSTFFSVFGYTCVIWKEDNTVLSRNCGLSIGLHNRFLSKQTTCHVKNARQIITSLASTCPLIYRVQGGPTKITPNLCSERRLGFQSKFYATLY